jgi:hypothetical protein
MKPPRPLLLTMSLMLVTACGGSGSNDRLGFDRACAGVPGCAEAQAAPSVPHETIWRVELVRAATGEVTIGRIEPVEVEQDRGVPVGRLAGSHLLAGLDAAGEPVDSALVSFPETLRIEGAADFAETRTIDLRGRNVDAYAYLRAVPGMVRVAVVDRAGRELATASLPRSVAVNRAPAAGWRLLAAAQSALSPVVLAQPHGGGAAADPPLPPHCAHVLILNGEVDRARTRGIAYEDKVIRFTAPQPTQRAVIHAALNMMTPMLCHGVSRIALAEVNYEGLYGAVNGFGTGDMMVINVAADFREPALVGSPDARIRMMGTILHETAHAAENLLNARGSRPGQFKGAWGVAGRSLAATTISHVRLEKGLRDEWQRVHASFVEQGWARRYAANDSERTSIQNASAEQVTHGGFMSRYGGTGYADDIADMVGWSYMGDHFRAAGIPEAARQTEDFGCQGLRGHAERSVPAQMAAFYTKLLFLRDLGLVRAADVERCTGDVGLPLDGAGFHFWEGSNFRRTMAQSLGARIGTRPNGAYVFEISGSGWASFDNTSYPADVRLTLALDGASTAVSEVAWPRGVYPLGLLDANTFHLRLDGAEAGNFNVYDGFALVAESSNRRIAGSVVINKALRPHAPLPVPQVFDPPLIVRFLIEK